MSEKVPTPEKQISVPIDVRALAEIAMTGVRRAAVFMGLGLNAAQSPALVDYRLANLDVPAGSASMAADFLPREASPDQIAEWKSQFALWIAGCGLRELLEHYGTLLDGIHYYALLVRWARGLDVGVNLDRMHRKFERNGVSGKLESLKQQFAIAPHGPAGIAGLYQARNALTHGLGTVMPNHADADGVVRLEWQAFEVFARGKESGTVVPFRELIGQVTREATAVEGRLVQRSKTFAVGELIVLSNQDLWEICFTFSFIWIPTIIAEFEKFLRTHDL